MTSITHTHPQQFAGKVALVTGGARGIGAAVVRRFVRDGAAVAFTYSSSQAVAHTLVDSIKAEGGIALAIPADAMDADAVTGAVDQVAAHFGRLDILVNNAGVVEWSVLSTFKLEDFDRLFSINVRSVFIATQAAVRHMREGGRIINIGSCNADRVQAPGGGVYAMTKSALVGLTRGFARDLGPLGITINNVQPGPTDTDMNPANGPYADSLHGLMAIPRHARADEIAAMVAYLASPETAMVTGANMLIDGGFVA